MIIDAGIAASSVGYGYPPAEHAEVGTRVSIRSEGHRHAATAAAEPLFDLPPQRPPTRRRAHGDAVSRTASPGRVRPVGRLRQTLRVSPIAVAPDWRQPLLAALSRPRYEILPLNGIVEGVLAHVPADVQLTVTASPKQGLDATLAVTEELRRHGYAVVSHISARLIRSIEHLDEVLGRLAAADVREIFVIAGDAQEPQGDYGGAAALLTAMGERRAHFDAIGISGYPESHHLISDEVTIEAMFAKEPMATHIISQICFDAEVIATWVARVRARGTMLPIWIGMPGSVDQQRLLRIALKVGLGESVGFLRSHRDWLRRLVLRRRYTPNRLIAALAPLVADPASHVAGFHVYTFNEVEATERWRQELLRHLA